MAARFVMSAPSYDKLPDLNLPEFAFIGRSNVGKSSLLNCIFKRIDLVRKSKTPGRTQLLNLFVMDEKAAFVDLPGYGYAKLSLAQRESLQTMIRGYLEKRSTVQGVVLLVDARREEGTEVDKAMVHWLLETGRPVLVGVTKGDYVPKTERLSRLRKIERGLGLPADCSILCSSKTGEGRDEILRRLSEIAKIRLT